MPQGIHRVLALRRLTAATFVLRLSREGLVFRAGQHVALRPAGQPDERDYSLYAGEQEPFLEVLVREVPEGVVSPRLGACRPGDALHLGGPTGVFVLDRRDVPEAGGAGGQPGAASGGRSGAGGGARRPLLFVASGTGVAPFHAMFRTWPGLPATLVHGVRHAAEAYDRADFPPDRHVLCTSRERAPGAFPGRVTDWLRAHPVAPGTAVFLCGNAQMIYDAQDILTAQGVPPQAISTEIYF